MLPLQLRRSQTRTECPQWPPARAHQACYNVCQNICGSRKSKTLLLHALLNHSDLNVLDECWLLQWKVKWTLSSLTIVAEMLPIWVSIQLWCIQSLAFSVPPYVFAYVVHVNCHCTFLCIWQMLQKHFPSGTVKPLTFDLLPSCASWRWWCGQHLSPKWPGQHRSPQLSVPYVGTGLGSWRRWCSSQQQTCSRPSCQWSEWAGKKGDLSKCYNGEVLAKQRRIFSWLVDGGTLVVKRKNTQARRHAHTHTQSMLELRPCVFCLKADQWE